MTDFEAPSAEPATELPMANPDPVGFDTVNPTRADLAEPAAGGDSAAPPFDESMTAAAPSPEPATPPPVDEDAPGAFMDILSRADAEAETSAPDGDKRKSS
jgi:hypothetical protein